MHNHRRQFLSSLSLAALATSALPSFANSEKSVDLAIIGGGLGGCAAALAALRNGLRVVLSEPTDWIGGQLTSQAVPPDEHRWIETHGANQSYRELRSSIRDYYRQHRPLLPQARDNPVLNPGNGSVSRLCCEPIVAWRVLQAQLAPYSATGQLQYLLQHQIHSADVSGDRIEAVTLQSQLTGDRHTLIAPLFVDATELGDLLPLAGAEWLTGAEAASETGELHACLTNDPANQQAFTVCFAAEYIDGQDHTIERPREYDFWREFVPQLTPAWPGRLLDLTYTHPRSGQPRKLGFDPRGGPVDGVLNLWLYRRILDRSLFESSPAPGDISLINWPQNDYLLGNLIDVSAEEAAGHIERARQLSLSLLYWLQTEVPRRDGGHGFPGLRLRPDWMGSDDGLAKAPYIRESRRIRAEFTVLEEHLGRQQRSQLLGQPEATVRAADFHDSVGVGAYAIDLHPTSSGDNYIDFETCPFQIPLGALLPVRLENLLPACKNMGTTHLTSGCYRLHPVEWGIGEAVGCLASFALQQHCSPRAVRQQPERMADFQKFLISQGVEIQWPNAL